MIFKTTNSGESWVRKDDYIAYSLYGLHFPTDALTGYVVGSSGGIAKTTDGGENWAIQRSGTNNNLYGVHFPLDAQTGYTVGDNGTILKTTDGGLTWLSQPSGGYPIQMWSVHFPTDSWTGYAAGIGEVVKTTDGGANWTRQTTGGWLRCVYFPVDARIGYAVGWGQNILKTTDGGASFVEQEAVGRSDGQTVGRLKAIPNPFLTFAKVPGQEGERFEMYDITGRKVGTYPGARIGWDLGPGVYFVRQKGERGAPVRIVKLR